MSFKNTIRSLISLLILALVALTAFGLVWWQSPPAPLAAHSAGGLAILALLLAVAVLGLLVLWRSPRPARSDRPRA